MACQAFGRIANTPKTDSPSPSSNMFQGRIVANVIISACILTSVPTSSAWMNIPYMARTSSSCIYLHDIDVFLRQTRSTGGTTPHTRSKIHRTHRSHVQLTVRQRKLYDADDDSGTRRDFGKNVCSTLTTVTASCLMQVQVLTTALLPAGAAEKSRKGVSSIDMLMEARMQLDLAVQASSVQAWSDAATLVQDPLLNESNLLDAFANMGSKISSSTPSPTSIEEFKAISLDAVSKMRNILVAEKSATITTEDAMAIMKYGTSARVAIDSYLELFGS